MKTAQTIMTPNPFCCTPDSKLTDVAKMMIQHNCGEIPVVDDLKNLRIAGVITDRDIVCRTLGKDLNPMDLIAADVMSFPPIIVKPETSLDECCKVMEKFQIRRVPVVDDFDKICGIISLADIVRQDLGHTIDVIKEVSSPTGMHPQ